MSRWTSESMRPLLARSQRSAVVRVVLWTWIGIAALVVALQMDSSVFASKGFVMRYPFFLAVLVLVGLVAAMRSKEVVAALTAMVVALALTAIAWIGGGAGA